MSRRSLARASHLVGALSFVVVASSARAQQIPATGLGHRTVSTNASASSPASAAIVPRDSAARYLRLAQTQRWTGRSLVAAGLATIAASYVQFSRSGRMGMSGSQAATMVVGTGIGAFGVTRWAAAHDSQIAAERWSGARVAGR